MEDTVRIIMQWLSVGLCVASLIVMYFWTRRNITRALWSVPVVIWVMHTLIYYGYVLLAGSLSLPTGFFGTWSAFLRLHGYIVVFTIAWELQRLNGKVDHHDFFRVS